MSRITPRDFVKDPDAVLPFGIDWTDWLVREGIASPSFSWQLPEGITSAEQSVQTVDGRTVAVAWISGGEHGRTYRVTCRVDDAATDKRDERSIVIQVRER